jgi:microcompartment protein CcmL/EutN
MKVRRTNFQKLVTSELVICAVNALTDEEAEQLVIQSEIVSRQSTDVEPVIERPTEEIESQPEAEEYTETVQTAEVEAEAE